MEKKKMIQYKVDKNLGSTQSLISMNFLYFYVNSEILYVSLCTVTCFIITVFRLQWKTSLFCLVSFFPIN